MERTPKGEKDYVTPDRIVVGAWGYRMSLGKTKTVAFCFDGKEIHVCKTPIHNHVHERLGTHDLLDFRSYCEYNLLAVWIYDEDLIIPQLKAFKRIYGRDGWRPFDIDSVRLIFVSGEAVVKCGFDELDAVGVIDRNDRMRAYHVTPPMLKGLVVDNGWKHAYFKEGERAWIRRHGNVDPAFWHLLMYEE